MESIGEVILIILAFTVVGMIIFFMFPMFFIVVLGSFMDAYREVKKKFPRTYFIWFIFLSLSLLFYFLLFLYMVSYEIETTKDVIFTVLAVLFVGMLIVGLYTIPILFGIALGMIIEFYKDVKKRFPRTYLIRFIFLCIILLFFALFPLYVIIFANR